MTKTEQEMTILREGGQREEITLGTTKLIVGELSIKERPKLFKVLENEWNAFLGASSSEQDRAAEGGLLGIIGEIFRTIIVLFFGERAKKHVGKAIEILNGVTSQDFKAIALCSIKFNDGLTKKKLKKLFDDAMASQVKDAVDRIFKINHIEDDIKNYLAAAQTLSGLVQAQGTHPSTAALETSQGAMPLSSRSLGGQENTSSVRPTHISNCSPKATGQTN